MEEVEPGVTVSVSALMVHQCPGF